MDELVQHQPLTGTAWLLGPRAEYEEPYQVKIASRFADVLFK